MPASAKKAKLGLAQMRELVLQELDHIPRWPKEQQSYLRSAYWFWRMNSLGKKAELPNDRAAVLQHCLDRLAKEHPGEEFSFDAAFFGGARRK
jgi:hypothetical protein